MVIAFLMTTAFLWLIQTRPSENNAIDLWRLNRSERAGGQHRRIGQRVFRKQGGATLDNGGVVWVGYGAERFWRDILRAG